VKKHLVLMLVATSLLSACVVHDGPYRDGGDHRGNREGPPNRSHDRDRDGVPDQRDSRPNNPNRY
jgi:hypothetical protein